MRLRIGICLLAVFPAILISQTFEVATVKSSSPEPHGGGMRGGPGTQDPGLLTIENIPMFAILTRAFQVTFYQLTEWRQFGDRYDITARIPEGTTKEQGDAMLRNLLIERFHIAFHRETREIDAYDLVVSKGGSKLKPSDLPDATPVSTTGAPKTDSQGFPQFEGPGLQLKGGSEASLYLRARAQPLSALITRLSYQYDGPLVDRTGLTGQYDYTLHFVPPASCRPTTVEPCLDSALQDQLGLKLEKKKAPVEMLVIDHIDKIPTAN